MKNIIAIIALTMLCINSYAGDKVDTDLAIEYLKVSKIEGVLNATIKQYEDQLYADSKPLEKEIFHKVMVSSLGWDATKNQLAEIVISLYTKEEIDASIAFMKSPAGASATEKSEEFSRLFASVVAANMQKATAECCSQEE
jgi:hypothetical protein